MWSNVYYKTFITIHTMKSKTRTEQDALGSYKLPADAPRGIYTARVLHNFPQKSIPSVPEEFLRIYVRVKIVYAHLNYTHKKVSKKTKDAIIKAGKKLLKMSSANFMSHFPVHQIQSGWGTSTNMNVNEVLANLATKELGGVFGQYLVNPHDDVNASQSSNDTFPGVTKLMLLSQLHNLRYELKRVEQTLSKLTKKFEKIKKVGRTHLQDAVVITLWDEFSGYARTIEKNHDYLQQAIETISEINFGGTATGSKQNISWSMRKNVINLLSKEFKLKLKQPKNYFEQNSSSGDLEYVAQTLSHLATDLIKMGNDLRFLSSGPLAGVHEIDLPAVQPGSSIMPGKVNPSVVEALTMVCAQVIGNSQTVHELTLLAQLELQQFTPWITWALYNSLDSLTHTLAVFDKHCLKWIKPNKQQIARLLDHSFAHATDYTEKYGYKAVAKAVKEALKTGKTLEEVINEVNK